MSTSDLEHSGCPIEASSPEVSTAQVDNFLYPHLNQKVLSATSIPRLLCKNVIIRRVPRMLCSCFSSCTRLHTVEDTRIN